MTLALVLGSTLALVAQAIEPPDAAMPSRSAATTDAGARLEPRHGEPIPAQPMECVQPDPARVLGWLWFPTEEPHLAPYLSAVNMYGSTCLEPNAVVEADPVSDAAQWVKSQLAQIGINYKLNNAYTLTAMTDAARGDSTLNLYTMQLLANWVVFSTGELGGMAGWVGLEANAGVGLGFDIDSESPQRNLRTVTWPNYGWVTSTAYISQLSWAQSFLDGALILQAGMVDPTIVMDANMYANNQYGQLMNWAFVNSQVVPFPSGSLGGTVQWQPADWLYVMVGTFANNTPAGRPPWFAVSGDNWSTVGEIGLVSQDTFGLGPGVLRVQPFCATVGGDFGGGVALNVEQRLGADMPLAFFGRFGFGSETTSQVNGAETQVAAGLAILGPDPSRKERQAFDYLAAGVAWTQAGSPAAIHGDELVFEVTAVRNLTPTLALQPDVQVILNPAFGAADVNVVLQLQLVLTW